MSRPSTVFINPRKIHINPNFFSAFPSTSSNTIHVNPRFIQLTSQNAPNPDPKPPLAISPPTSRHRLVRKNTFPVPSRTKTSPIRHAIVKSKHKLIRNGAKKVQTKKTTNPLLRSKHKKVEVLRINGVAYRSSRNKLMRLLPSVPPSEKVLRHQLFLSDKLLSLQAGKFLLRSRGNVLQKVGCAAFDPPGHKIEVAGMLFSSLGDGQYRRVQQMRLKTQYLVSTKSRSINVLKLRKSNVPCPIFRRLGKCLAMTRGRCPKSHDPKYIMVCPDFLRGSCSKSLCLLSHDTSLSKMPVCRFFLQGICTTDKCPYLHKKVSETEKMCLEFQKGYCELAEKCPRRHEFIVDGSKRLKRAKFPAPSVTPKPQKPAVDKNVPSSSRYFHSEPTDLSQESQRKLDKVLSKVRQMKAHDEKREESTDKGAEEEREQKKRPPLGSLPSFIPV